MKTLVLTILLSYACICHATDMYKYREHTKSLITSGLYKEALERTIWFHNNALKHQPSLYGVRTSYALGAWIEFGKKYPPALVALKDIRDSSTSILLSGSGSCDLFHDVYYINKYLSEKNKSILLFKQLDKVQPIFANKCWYIIKDDMINGNYFGIVKKYIGNIQEEYSKTENQFKELIDIYNNEVDSGAEYSKGLIKTRYVKKTKQLIKLSTMANDSDSATAIKDKAQRIVIQYNIVTTSFK